MAATPDISCPQRGPKDSVRCREGSHGATGHTPVSTIQKTRVACGFYPSFRLSPTHTPGDACEETRRAARNKAVSNTDKIPRGATLEESEAATLDFSCLQAGAKTFWSTLGGVLGSFRAQTCLYGQNSSGSYSGDDSWPFRSVHKTYVYLSQHTQCSSSSNRRGVGGCCLSPEGTKMLLKMPGSSPVVLPGMDLPPA